MSHAPSLYARALALLAAENRLNAPAISRFLKLLRKHRNLSGLTQILRQFQRTYDTTAGITRIEVSAARSPERLASVLRKRLGKKAVISERVRPELIGGAHVRINDAISIDASVRRQLQRLFPSVM